SFFVNRVANLSRETITPVMMNAAPTPRRQPRVSLRTRYPKTAAVTGSSAYRIAACVEETVLGAEVGRRAATRVPRRAMKVTCAAKSQLMGLGPASLATNAGSDFGSEAEPAIQVRMKYAESESAATTITCTAANV